MTERKYYEAYDDRYRTAHSLGQSWAGSERTPIVLDTVEKYGFSRSSKLFEAGCGEGRDSRALLEEGYDLTAADISEEAIRYCRNVMPEFSGSFIRLDCTGDDHPYRYDFIFSVAVIHMLVEDEDRSAFLRFIINHLSDNGLALICSMGDGVFEMKSDISQAFIPQVREHRSGKMTVAATSCRMVSFETFTRELADNGFNIVEKGITSSMPEFNSLMYAVVNKKATE